MYWWSMVFVNQRYPSRSDIRILRKQATFPVWVAEEQSAGMLARTRASTAASRVLPRVTHVLCAEACASAVYTNTSRASTHCKALFCAFAVRYTNVTDVCVLTGHLWRV